MDTTTGSEWELQTGRDFGEAPYVDPHFVLQHSQSINLVDLRSSDEAAGLVGHIPGSLFLSEDRLRELAALEDRMPIVLVSTRGRRAAAAARQLTDQGVTEVAAMLGGLAAWRQQGFATSRRVPRTAQALQPLGSAPVAPTGDARRLLTLEDVRAHIGNPRSVQWIQVASLQFQAHLSCVDGRDARGVIGSLGGDAGEFVLALAAVEQVGRMTLNEDEIQQTLLAHIDTFGDFYLHSDEGALDALVAALRADSRFAATADAIPDISGWADFLQQPGRALEGPLLEHLTVPAHVGCGHLRLMLQHSDEYGVRKELVEGTLRSVNRLRWAGATEFPFVVLPGAHGEGAVVNIRLPEEPWGLGLVPVISPAFEGTSIFVNHSDVAAILRGTAVEFHCRKITPATVDPSMAKALQSEIDRLGAQQLAATVGYLAKGLPIYDATFQTDGTIDVQRTG